MRNIILFLTIILTLSSTKSYSEINLVSIGPNGQQSEIDQLGFGNASISSSGRYISFLSHFSSDLNEYGQIFVRDTVTEETTFVSIGVDGILANMSSKESSISADGRFVVFTSRSSNLVPGDTNDRSDIFLHDRESRYTTRVSVSSDGVQGNGWSKEPAISANGQFIAFSSNSSNLDSRPTGQGDNIYVHDRINGITTNISYPTYESSLGYYSDGPASISADGRFVAFESSWPRLDPNYIANGNNIYVHDRNTSTNTLISVSATGESANSYCDAPSMSADGRFVSFSSLASNLVSNDTNSFWDIFVHDRQSGQITRVNVSSLGQQSNNRTFYSSISANGRFVAFDSEASNLVPNDSNSSFDVFVHDREAGKTSLISKVSQNDQAVGGFLEQISDDGSFVVFKSYSSDLVPNDLNEKNDLFVYQPEDCPDDPNKSEPGICGCGVSDEIDTDHDGTPDCIDYITVNNGKVFTVDENQSVTIDFTVSPPSDDLYFGVSSNTVPAEQLEYVPTGDNTYSLTWTPDFEQTGFHMINLVLYDSQDAVVYVEIIWITVNDVNQAPIVSITSPSLAFRAGFEISLRVDASDPDDPLGLYQLSYSYDGPDGMLLAEEVDLTKLIWTPGADEIGDYTVKVTVTDTYGASDTDTYTITVVSSIVHDYVIDNGFPGTRIDSANNCQLGNSATNLVVITHGWASNASTWVTSLRNKIYEKIPNNEKENWDVCIYDWGDDAGSIAPPTDPIVAYYNANYHGAWLGEQILAGNYKHIHLIAHSAGSNLIQEAVNHLYEINDFSNDLELPETIHLTFLDAYAPLSAVSEYGKNADWAEHYFDTRNISIVGSLLDDTGVRLSEAMNFDVTGLDVERGIGGTELFNGWVEHAWPYRWYGYSIDQDVAQLDVPEGSFINLKLLEMSTSVYGFSTSFESGRKILLNHININERGKCLDLAGTYGDFFTDCDGNLTILNPPDSNFWILMMPAILSAGKK